VSVDRDDLGGLSTEAVRPELAELDLLPLVELVALLTSDSRRASDAAVDACAAIVEGVEMVVERLAGGGRLVYVGAGTAGRLAVLDAAELGPTFDVDEGTVVAVIAGGEAALRHAVEGAEDDPSAGGRALEDLAVGAADAVVGVSASGRTPFVLGALARGSEVGAATIAITSNEASRVAAVAQCCIVLPVGGEVIAGSSRMNAGTAQKIVLNAISSAAMVRLGKTYGNLMVDLRATNSKLRGRAVRIVRSVTGVDEEQALVALKTAGWNTKLACLVAATESDASSRGHLEGALEQTGGRLRQALALVGGQTAAGAPPVRAPASRWRRLGVEAALVAGRLVPGDVAVDGARVAATGLPGRGRGFALPGLVDLQVNGYAGIDVATAGTDELAALGAALLADGVFAYQPSLITGDPAAALAALSRIATFSATPFAERRSGRAEVIGVHLEGPFLSPRRAGTHPAQWLLEPDAALTERLLAAGPVSMVTLAPELAGALEVIGHLARRGIVVALGHSDASAEDARRAVEAGARAVTHLFNAMPPVTARQPGLAGAALADPRLTLCVIGDGVHVSSELLALVLAAAPSRLCLVSDATSLAGGSAGAQHLSEVAIELVDGVARRADGTIAGGARALLDGVRQLASLTPDLAAVFAAASEHPARLLGRDDVGCLRPGGAADLVVLDDDLSLREIVVGGQSPKVVRG